MKDPVNPTPRDIEDWARTPEALYPMEDWDLMVASDENGELLVGLAADPSVSKRDAVLNFLYVYAGQVVREGSRAERVARLRSAVEDAALSDWDPLRRWAGLATTLLAGRGPDPRAGASAGEYAFWFAHGWKG